jgi:hypothetical protein
MYSIIYLGSSLAVQYPPRTPLPRIWNSFKPTSMLKPHLRNAPRSRSRKHSRDTIPAPPWNIQTHHPTTPTALPPSSSIPVSAVSSASSSSSSQPSARSPHRPSHPPRRRRHCSKSNDIPSRRRSLVRFAFLHNTTLPFPIAARSSM